MSKKNVVVFPAANGVGQEVMKSLRFSKHFNAIPLNTGDGKIWTDVFDNKNVNEIMSVAVDLDALILPCHDEFIHKLSLHRPQELVFGSCSYLVPWRDKKQLYYTLSSEGIPVPRVSGEPVATFIKPRCGQGSKGEYRKIDVPPFPDIRDDLFVCEYLPGEELTVDCFTDRMGGLRFVSTRTREKVVDGRSVTTFLKPIKETERIAIQLNNLVKPRGAWFFQVKQDLKGVYKVIDIGLRIAGASGINRLNGVNLTELSLWDYLGYDVKINNSWSVPSVVNNKPNLCVQYGNIYCDWDDTLVVDGKPNIELAAKLFTAKLSGKKLTLLSRNKNLPMELNKFPDLANLFHVSISVSGDKADYIEPYSMFIDDSFSERRSVNQKKPMVSLGPQEAIELL